MTSPDHVVVQDVVWDLRPVAPTSATVPEAVGNARAAARRWAATSPSTPEALSRWLHDIGAVHSALTQAATYLALRASDGSFDADCEQLELDLTDAVEVADGTTRDVQRALRSLDDAEFDGLLADPLLAPYRTWLRADRGQGTDHPVTDELAEHVDAHDRVVGAMWVDTLFARGPVDAVVDAARDLPDAQAREVFERATAEFETNAGSLAGSLSQIVRIRLGDADLHDLWAERARSNQVSPAFAEEVLDTIRSGQDSARDWVDRGHAGMPVDVTVPYDAACSLIMAALDAVDTSWGDVVRRMIAERTIHASPSEHKPVGAFCVLVSPGHPPFVSLGYRDRVRDVLRLAHEVGHALHYTLAARRVPPLVAESPPVTSEMCAFLVQWIVVRHVLREPADPRLRSALGHQAQQDAVNATFRQVAICDWESAVYRRVTAEGRMDADEMCASWLRAASCLTPLDHGRDAFRYDWMRVPHIVREAYYNATYPISYLLALAATSRPLDADMITEFLSSGAAHTVDEQFAMLGVGLDDCATGMRALREVLTGRVLSPVDH